MGKNSTARMEEIIRRTFKETLEEALEALNEKQRSYDRNYFKDTEKLLYAYPALILQVKEIERDIEDLKKEGYTGRSKDVVLMRSSSNLSRDDIQAQKIEDRMAGLERTKREIIRIERALERVKDDPGYQIIEMKYFKEMTNEEIAEKVDYSVRTVIRHKNRLINKLKIFFFGADALDI